MEKIKIMFSLAILYSLYGCSIYDGMSMKPHKTTISTTSIDKADDDKDQEKNSMGITLKQEFIWREKR